jgi:hypothetical protein
MALTFIYGPNMTRLFFPLAIAFATALAAQPKTSFHLDLTGISVTALYSEITGFGPPPANRFTTFPSVFSKRAIIGWTVRPWDFRLPRPLPRLELNCDA